MDGCGGGMVLRLVRAEQQLYKQWRVYNGSKRLALDACQGLWHKGFEGGLCTAYNGWLFVSGNVSLIFYWQYGAWPWRNRTARAIRARIWPSDREADSKVRHLPFIQRGRQRIGVDEDKNNDMWVKQINKVDNKCHTGYINVVIKIIPYGVFLCAIIGLTYKICPLLLKKDKINQLIPYVKINAVLGHNVFVLKIVLLGCLIRTMINGQRRKCLHLVLPLEQILTSVQLQNRKFTHNFNYIKKGTHKWENNILHGLN